MSTFVKIKREESLSNKVEIQIRQAISKRIFLPGDKLPSEMELCDHFGVSRTALREALHMLSGRGLVDIRKGSGVYVSQIEPSDLVDSFYQFVEMKCGDNGFLHIVQVRLILEPELARLSAVNRSEQDLQHLESCLDEMLANSSKPLRMVESDIKFHRTIAQSTGNPLIPVIMEPIFGLLSKFISSTYRQSHAPDLAIEKHRNLLEALRRQNQQTAYEIMRDHLSIAEAHVHKYYENIAQLDQPIP